MLSRTSIVALNPNGWFNFGSWTGDPMVLTFDVCEPGLLILPNWGMIGEPGILSL